MEGGSLGSYFSDEPLPGWKFYRGRRMLLRGLGFIAVMAFFISLDVYLKSIDIIDVLIAITFGFAAAVELLSYARSRGGMYTETSMVDMEGIAKVVEAALDARFLTYRKKKVIPFLVSSALRARWRYELESFDINVTLLEGSERTFVCLAPVNEVTEVHVRGLAMELSKALSRGPGGSTTG